MNKTFLLDFYKVFVRSRYVRTDGSTLFPDGIPCVKEGELYRVVRYFLEPDQLSFIDRLSSGKGLAYIDPNAITGVKGYDDDEISA